MLTVDQVKELIGEIKDPIIGVPLREIEGIIEVSIKEEEKHVSVKVTMVQSGGAPQLDLQMTVVNVLRENDVKTVNIRFETLPEEEVNQLEPKEEDKPKTIEGLLSQNNPVELIAIVSDRGGVGEPAVTINLAVASAREDKKVGLVDANIYGLSVLDMMDIDEKPGISGRGVIPVEYYGVKVIPMIFFVEENVPVIWRGPMLGKMSTSLFIGVRRGGVEYLILDLPPGAGDIALDVHTMLPSSKEITVAISYPTVAFVVACAGAMAKHMNHPILGVIESMSYFENRKMGSKEYVSGKSGGIKLADELNTQSPGELSLKQPSWNPKGFISSIYQSDDRLGRIYSSIAQKVIAAADK